MIDPQQALAEHLPRLTVQEALVEANRCLFCFDAPCAQACPTHIDIARFIKKITTDNLLGSARTILESNLLGATCARVCPVEELCVGACVLGSEHKPIAIGRLQRYATDYVYDRAIDVFRAGPSTGKKVAVVGAGPAGLSCAGELARRGHSVTIFEKRDLGGGLSTYGIIGLREPMEAALAEVEMIRRLGVRIETGRELGRNLDLGHLRANYDAVFLGVGLGATPDMEIAGEEHILDGLAYIERSKVDPQAMKIGRHVAVIGAGNTAVDCATIAKRLGAERVTMIYRRSEREMTAYAHEYEFVKKEGVEFRFLTQPLRVLVNNGTVTGLACVRVQLGAEDASRRPAPRPVEGSEFVLGVDQVVKAIGQKMTTVAALLGLATEKGKIRVNELLETNVAGIYAGGDCIRSRGAASTVMGVRDGNLAARAIHGRLLREGASHGGPEN
jgi:dihydropyrimidine dehydrogenase (NAD+) subunit PreT